MLIFDVPPLKIYAAPLSGGGLSVARAAVSSLLREAFPGDEVCLTHDPDGAPRLAGAPGQPAVSVSHSRSLAILALSDGLASLGVDTETTDRPRQIARVSHKFLDAGQQQEWGGSPFSLLVAWCIKEAVYKCARIPGLPLASIPLPPVGFIASGEATVCLGDQLLRLLMIPEYGPCGPIVVALREKPVPFCR